VEAALARHPLAGPLFAAGWSEGLVDASEAFVELCWPACEGWRPAEGQRGKRTEETGGRERGLGDGGRKEKRLECATCVLERRTRGAAVSSVPTAECAQHAYLIV
jgi:hypothetical protein